MYLLFKEYRFNTEFVIKSRKLTTLLDYVKQEYKQHTVENNMYGQIIITRPHGLQHFNDYVLKIVEDK